VVLDGRVLIDGGYVNPVPFDVVEDPADVIIAVDVTGDTQPRGGAKDSTVPRPFEVRVGAAQLLFNSVTREKLKAFAPDILIRPAVSRFRSFDYFKIADILAAAEPVKEEVKRQLAQHLDGAR
jgi:NTE family protein